MNEDGLKNCPFCGNAEAYFMTVNDERARYKVSEIIEINCRGCNTVIFGNTFEEVTETWNKRA